MGRPACTEPQCLYSRAIPLLPLWAVLPVQGCSLPLPFTVIVVLSYKHGAQQGGAFQITTTSIAVWGYSVV